MKGWLLKAAHEPLELVERPDPVPGPGQIAIDIKAAGLCHSDVGLMEGITISQLAYYPIIIGHEFAGTVYAVGEGVTDFKIGDRVACRAGYGAPGVSMEGAYADKTVAPAMYCTIVPDDVPWAQAAAATDAGLTAYHAVAKTAGIKAGDRVGIVGIGGLGTNAVQVALALGAEVYGSTRKAAVREEVERMGVKDSKRLAPNRRTILSRKLKKMFEYDIIVITAREIDEMRAEGINLNEIEKNAMEELILRLKPEKAIVDAVDVKAERFQENLRKDTGFDVIAEHKADDTYIQVGAASIIAKAERDAQIAEINKEYIKSGGIGSGYPSDPTTKKFLSNYTYDEMPDFVRRSWNTVAKMR